MVECQKKYIDMSKKGYTYIITNKKNGTLYIGVTSNLLKRIYEHKQGLIDGFSKKYNLKNWFIMKYTNILMRQ